MKFKFVLTNQNHFRIQIDSQFALIKMNSNRYQSNKENCNSLLNGKITNVSLRQVMIKELSSNNSYMVSKNVKFRTESTDKRTLEIGVSQKDTNIQHVPQYQQSIFSYLKTKDVQFCLNPLYMEFQTDINPRMRSILIDWLIDVHIKFKLLPQTLFMTVDLIDRFLSTEKVARQSLQLVGITSLMMICKYEEIYPPLIKDFVAVCDNAYSKEQILEMESQIIVSLDFEFTVTSCFVFLEYFQTQIQLEPKALVFSRYILENALFDLKALKYSKHVLASGAVYLVNKIFRRKTWKLECEKITGVDEQTAKKCAKDLFNTMQEMETINLTALKRKFSTLELFEVSKYRIEKEKTN